MTERWSWLDDELRVGPELVALDEDDELDDEEWEDDDWDDDDEEDDWDDDEDDEDWDEWYEDDDDTGFHRRRSGRPAWN